MQDLVLAGAGLALALGTLLTQPQPPGTSRVYDAYGPPEAVDLDAVAYNSESYQRRKVVTKGELRPLGGLLDKFQLVDGTARVLVIPVPELADGPRRLIGRRVEVTGIVRSLPTSQQMVGCRAQMMLESKCADPDLPALPNAQVDWPPVSITIFDLSESGASPRAAGESEGIDLADIVKPDTAFAGQTVRVIGLFGGRDLLGELPPGSAPSPQDWVLRQPPHAIWVTGRKPQGRGWKLDPTYKGDGVRWIEVSGRVEVRGGVAVLRASKVTLVAAPRAAAPE
ncbi:MAG TPA: hypothetical protein VFQ51_17065 [Vicinamibacteria bacterium]|nr:hypothetical protein [Vicinamibacteria bacterium]